jgi:hypothetical protein
LAYGISDLSLSATATWAGSGGIADLSAVALYNRLRKAGPWIEGLWQTLLRQQVKVSPLPGLNMPVRLIDGSCVSGRKSKGTDYRLHFDYHPQDGRFGDVVLGDGRMSEGFHHFTPKPGELFLGDRAYATVRSITHVLAAHGHVLVRMGWNALVLLDPQGNPFDLISTLKGLPKDRTHSLPVQIGASAKQRQPVCSARLILAPLPPEAAEKSKRKAAKKSKRQGRKGPRPESRVAAEWLILLTTLPEDVASPQQLIELYRLRWQIELAFKRLKSILGIGDMPTKDPRLAKTWLSANLLVALLIDRLNIRLADDLPTEMADRRPTWRLYVLARLQLFIVIIQIDRLDPFALRRLVEAHRKKRKLQLPKLVGVLSPPQSAQPFTA